VSVMNSMKNLEEIKQQNLPITPEH